MTDNKQRTFLRNQIYLKVKAKSLAEEAKIIRTEEAKAAAHERFRDAHGWNMVHWGLYYHRINDVRKEARATNLVRAFLKGRPACTVEKPTNKSAVTEFNKPYNVYALQSRFLSMAEKYGAHSKVYEGCESKEDRERIAKSWFNNHFNLKT